MDNLGFVVIPSLAEQVRENRSPRKEFLWEELTVLISWWDLPWGTGADFNVTRFPSEQLGKADFSLAMEEF